MASPEKSIKHTTYFPVYDYLLEPYKNKQVCFVEVGVLSGGSLFMWRKFLGPEARIIGVDLNPEAKKWERFGFEIHIGNQSDPEFWTKFFGQVGQIDVLLDDGGHTFYQQIQTAQSCVPMIRDGGLLIVEDTHTSYMGGFGFKGFSFVRWAKTLVDRVNARFSMLNGNPRTNAVWAVEFFESFVVFRINRVLCALKSEPISNSSVSSTALDFRSQDPLSRGGMSALGTFFPQVSLARLFKKKI